jgi:hypothetical protein
MARLIRLYWRCISELRRGRAVYHVGLVVHRHAHTRFPPILFLAHKYPILGPTVTDDIFLFVGPYRLTPPKINHRPTIGSPS